MENLFTRYSLVIKSLKSLYYMDPVITLSSQKDQNTVKPAPMTPYVIDTIEKKK